MRIISEGESRFFILFLWAGACGARRNVFCFEQRESEKRWYKKKKKKKENAARKKKTVAGPANELRHPPPFNPSERPAAGTDERGGCGQARMPRKSMGGTETERGTIIILEREVGTGRTIQKPREPNGQSK